MRKVNKMKLIKILTCVAVISFCALACIIYLKNYKEKRIVSEDSNTEQCHLNIYQIGKPKQRYNTIYYKLEIQKDENIVSEYMFPIESEKELTADNFNVMWCTQYVQVVISYGKNLEEKYSIDYEGNVKKEKADISMYSNIAMFSHFGVVGDSYASGELYYDDKYVDKYEISWGQILARKLGTICTNYSSGGLSTQTWLNAENGLSLLIKNPPEDIYYLVLGINDYWNLGEKYLGSINDIGNFKTKDDYQDSFYGNYGRIIEEIQEHAPNAKLVMFTCADTSELAEKFNKAIIEIANYYKIPYIVQSENTFFQSEINQNMSGGHPTALAYSGMANAFEELLNACLIEHQDYFFDSYMYD